MVQLSRSRSLAAACLLVALGALATPAFAADDPLNHLGPVGPSEPILVTVGTQRVIAFYVPERGECAVSTVMWKDAGADAPYASSRVRISLKPGQMVKVDGPQRQSLGLLCGADASTLSVVAPAELVLTGAHAND